MDPLAPGRIFWAIYPGDRGDNKTRPMIVVTRRLDIIRTKKVIAVVCSTRFSEPINTQTEIILPWDPNGRCGTRLHKKTVAVCDWTAEIDCDAITKTGGVVPTNILKTIYDLAGITRLAER